MTSRASLDSSQVQAPPTSLSTITRCLALGSQAVLHFWGVPEGLRPRWDWRWSWACYVMWKHSDILSDLNEDPTVEPGMIPGCQWCSGGWFSSLHLEGPMRGCGLAQLNGNQRPSKIRRWVKGTTADAETARIRCAKSLTSAKTKISS
jgi:hypothetical protein